MARKTKTSEIERQYRKERQRIQRQIKRLENRGYLTPDSVLPSIPKRITAASVRRLNKIDLTSLYSKSRYVDQSTGEVVSGLQGRKLERQSRAKKAAQTRKNKRSSYSPAPTIPENEIGYANFSTTVFFNFQNQMSQIFGNNPKLLNYLIRWFQNSIQTYGEEDFAEALYKSYEDGEWPGWEAISDETLLVGSLRAIINQVGGSQGAVNEIMEELEYGEEWIDV